MDLTNRSPRLLRILALAALGLGFLAIFAESPSRTTVSFDLQELASIIEHEGDHMAPGQLASMIMNSRGMFRIIDVRDSASYAAYHLPGAEHFELAGLIAGHFKPLETLVLYSQGGTHASQAWFLLKARGLKNVYTLRGGLDLWDAVVRYPVVPSEAPRAVRDSVAALAAFFEGSISDRRPESTISLPAPHAHKKPILFQRERERTRDGC